MITWNDYTHRSSNKIIAKLLLESTLDWREYFHASQQQLQFLRKLVKRRIQVSTFLPYVQNEDHIGKMKIAIHKLLEKLLIHQNNISEVGLRVSDEKIEPAFSQFLLLQEELIYVQEQLEQDKTYHIHMLTSLTS